MWAIEESSYSATVLNCLRDKRLKELLKISDNQNWFPKGKSTAEPIFCLRMLQVKSREYDEKLDMVFVDLEKRLKYYPKRANLVLFEKATSVKSLYWHYEEYIPWLYHQVVTSSGETKEIRIDVESHQQPALSPLLFQKTAKRDSKDSKEGTR